MGFCDRVIPTTTVIARFDRAIQYVRPAWALTWRWKSSRELVTASEGKRRASSREDGVKEAWNEAAGRRTDIG
jgi:hypothetical protein